MAGRGSWCAPASIEQQLADQSVEPRALELDYTTQKQGDVARDRGSRPHAERPRLAAAAGQRARHRCGRARARQGGHPHRRAGVRHAHERGADCRARHGRVRPASVARTRHARRFERRHPAARIERQWPVQTLSPDPRRRKAGSVLLVAVALLGARCVRARRRPACRPATPSCRSTSRPPRRTSTTRTTRCCSSA